jgi:hypothetical protein
MLGYEATEARRPLLPNMPPGVRNFWCLMVFPVIVILPRGANQGGCQQHRESRWYARLAYGKEHCLDTPWIDKSQPWLAVWRNPLVNGYPLAILE